MIYQIVPRDAGSFHSFVMTLRRCLRWGGSVREAFVALVPLPWPSPARGEGNEFNPLGRDITKESIIDGFVKSPSVPL